MKHRQKQKNAKNAENSPTKKLQEASEAPYISMDFGTSFLLVSYVNNGKIEIMTNEDGCRTTPSYVSFTETEILVGDTARAQFYRNPKNTIYDVKKLIGKTYEEVQDLLPQWKFVVKNDGGNPAISIIVEGKEKLYKPTEIAAIMFGKMKRIAEMTTSASVKKVVITIPSFFNEAQTRAMIEAVQLAGMEPVKLLRESIASVISYEFDKIQGEKKILDFHFGGGSFDLILIRSLDGILEVIGEYNNPNLRGKNFDDRILELCVAEFEKQAGINIKSNTKAIKKLELICEVAKVVLSTAVSVPIEADSLAEGIDFSMKLFRPKYEAICADLFAQIIPPIEKLLAQFKLNKTEIDEIIIEGGLGKTPKISEILKEYFGKEPRNQVDPDEIIVYGSAMQSMYLEKSLCSQESMLVRKTCCTLSLETAIGQTKVVVSTGSPVPLRKAISLTVNKPIYLGKNEETKNYVVPINLYAGDSKLASNCRLIATVNLEYEPGILIEMVRSFHVELLIEIHEDGLMKFTAKDKHHAKKNSVTLSNFLPLPFTNVTRAEKTDQEIIAVVEQLRELKSYCYSVLILSRKLGIELEAKSDFAANGVAKNLAWVAEHIYDPKLEPAIGVECQARRKALEDSFKSLLTQELSHSIKNK